MGKKCARCNGTGQIPKPKSFTMYPGFMNAQMDGLVRKTSTCPKCFGHGVK
jgi:ribosomal protein S27AE